MKRQIFKQTVIADWQTESTTDTQYAIEETADKLIIKLQGSVSRIDWIQNFSFWKKPYKQMNNIFFVHSGFLKKYKAIRAIIQEAVYKNLDKKIIVLGYSQGAALALLVHEDIVFTFGKTPETTVFGCPRVFSIFGRKTLKKRLQGVTRYHNGNDIVCRVPFTWLLFRHYGNKIHIGNKYRWWKLSIKDHITYSENLEG